MKAGNKNLELKALIEKVKKKGIEKHPYLKAVAKGLSKPRRRTYEVNLFRLEKYADEKDLVIVPGNVLGTGEVTKAFTVAALKFSASAKHKIEKAGGKCLSIEDIIEDTPSGKTVKIIG